MSAEARPRKLCYHCHAKPAAAQGLCMACYQYRRRNKTLERIQGDSTYHTDGKRCRCGLRLPCNDCLPAHLHEFMEQRMAKESNA